MLKNSIRGFFMSMADSIPGISGGTIAYILGFYDLFVNSIDNIFHKEKRKEAFKFLSQLAFGWIIGFCLCIILLASLFESHIYFMSSFLLGLTFFSLPIIIKSEINIFKTNISSIVKYLFFLLFGFSLVIFITKARSFNSISITSLNNLNLKLLLYLFFSGMIAISAMVLPGISGSSILLILGLYIPIINAIKEFLNFDFSFVPSLFAFGIGMIIGIITTVKIVKNCLIKHRSSTISFIFGLIIAALYAIIEGPTTLEIPQNPLTFDTFNFIAFILGAFIIFILNKLNQSK